MERGRRLLTLPLGPTTDVPDVENHTFTSTIHWLVPNINLSASTRIFPSPSFPASSSKHNVSLPNPYFPYVPPHPHKGTPYHRYTFIVLSHDEPLELGELRRSKFDFKKWQAGLPEGTRVEGATFFRAEYDAEACAEVWEKFMRTFSQTRLYRVALFGS
jgi:large subunit ribosomal protein L35